MWKGKRLRDRRWRKWDGQRMPLHMLKSKNGECTMPQKKKAHTLAQKDQCCLLSSHNEMERWVCCVLATAKWLHRYCAGVTSHNYQSITEKAFIFYLVRHDSDNWVSLKVEIAVLRLPQSQLLPFVLQPASQSVWSSAPLDRMPSVPAAMSISVSTFAVTLFDNHARKFNVIMTL